jgi:hypothetical protein
MELLLRRSAIALLITKLPDLRHVYCHGHKSPPLYLILKQSIPFSLPMSQVGSSLQTVRYKFVTNSEFSAT